MRITIFPAMLLSLFIVNTYAAEKSWRVYLGTYTSGTSKGIYVSRFDSKTGALSTPELAVETKNPSFLTAHPNGRWLYAVSEASGGQGKPAGGVSAFEVESQTGKLTLLNQQSSGGTGPCHVALDRSGKVLLVANYGSGSISALKVNPDGTLSPGSTLQHEGSSVNPRRQTSPHAHQAVVSPDNRFALFCDLGIDRVMIYTLASPAAELAPHSPPAAALKPGAGPRHLAFSPDGKFFYVINELQSSMTVFAWDARKGTAAEVQTLTTLPEGFEGESWCAAVDAHPGGRFVYGSNRGHDSIVVFARDRKTGRLSLVGHSPSGGKYPRFIGLDPTGKWMLSLNQNSNNLLVLPVDARTGTLGAPASELQLGSPVCAVFVPAGK